MDEIKAEIEIDDRYLNGDLSSSFLEKDQDVLSSIDMDLIHKKITLDYDPNYDQFPDLQSEKFLEECAKDAFILPEFHLDNLDPLTLGSSDMMVAGEILPSTSSQPDDLVQDFEETTKIISKGLKTPEINNYAQLNSPKSTENNELEEQMVVFEDSQHNCEETKFLKDCEILENASLEISPIDTCEIQPKPTIIRKNKRILKLNGSNAEYSSGESQTESKDGVMAVVAISTDKTSNMTQIVINTGKEEQIYQGKTSELMQATGYFPELTTIDDDNNWTDQIDGKDSNATNHDIIITNALKELGYTEESLISVALITTENGKIWICPKQDCRREFSRLYALKSHLLAHYGVRPFKCDYDGCTWAFHSDFKLKRHKDTHLKRKDYICKVPDCNRRFTTVYNLWTHEKLHSRPNRIACHVPDCTERFQTKRALEIHMKSHDQEHAPYVCTQEGCGKRYYSSNALTSHQRCHSYKEIDIKCGWAGCGKVFDKPCRLKAHIRSHTGAKPYSCTHPGCEWAFSSSSKLKRHEKKHTNERKFVCDFQGCTKAFMRSEHLKEHRLTHEEGRFFNCYMCDAKFSAKSSLYVHIKKHQNRENNGSLQNYPTKASSIEKVNLEDFESVETISEELTVDGKTMKLTDSMQMHSDGSEVISSQSDVQTQKIKLKYICPEISCGKIYSSKSSLRVHTSKAHTFEETSDQNNCKESLNYVFYECERLNLDEETVHCPEDAATSDHESGSALPGHDPPPPLNENLTSAEFAKTKQDHGAARTGLTYADVSKLKTKSTILNFVGPSDVVLGAADFGDELLLSEEFPSMYYSDELGSECQILLLDTGDSENPINLRELE